RASSGRRPPPAAPSACREAAPPARSPGGARVRRGRSDAEAEAADGDDEVVADLAAQAQDEVVDGARADVELVGAPDAGEELGTRQRAAAAEDERRQKGDLERGERHAVVVDPQLVAGAVEREAAVAEEVARPLPLARRAAGEGAQPRRQLARRRAPGDEVV